MPLIRIDDDFRIAPGFGVIFSLVDTGNRDRVLCAIDKHALMDRSCADGKTDKDWPDAWRRHRTAIEAAASANYDNHEPLVEGRVLVRLSDIKL